MEFIYQLKVNKESYYFDDRMATYYTKVMERVQSKGDGFVATEIERLERMLGKTKIFPNTNFQLYSDYLHLHEKQSSFNLFIVHYEIIIFAHPKAAVWPNDELLDVFFISVASFNNQHGLTLFNINSVKLHVICLLVNSL